MSRSEVKTEWLGALHQASNVGVTPNEVIDKLLPGCLLLADDSTSSTLVALDEHGYDGPNGGQDRLRRE